jgi:hypothetical protein
VVVPDGGTVLLGSLKRLPRSVVQTIPTPFADKCSRKKEANRFRFDLDAFTDGGKKPRPPDAKCAISPFSSTLNQSRSCVSSSMSVIIVHLPIILLIASRQVRAKKEEKKKKRGRSSFSRS